MCIQQIRNETLKITYGGVTFLLDPWQQDRGQGPCFRAVRDDRKDVRSPMDDLPFAPSEILGGANYLLYSHLHPDHFTKEHLVGSCARTG